MNQSKYTVSVVSDLYLAGLTEDGTEYHAEIFFVQAENEQGRRFRHALRGYLGAKRVTDEDGLVGFEDVRAEAFARASRLADRINRALEEGSSLDFAQWREIDPAYASPEYISQGIEAERALADQHN